MKKRIVRRLTSAVCAFAMLLGSVSVYFPLNAFAEEQVVSGEQAQTQLTHQSIELYPNGEQAQQVVTLDGMMPKGATAEAVDVSDEQQGTAAYDITITDGDSEFQPSKDSPIRVEITDPKITQGSSIELWHIRDDGVREQITDFTFEDGKISFYAAGFSVYEIVVDDDVQPYTGSQGWIKAQSLETVVANAQKGMYIGNIGGTYFFTSHQESNVGSNSSRTGITKTKLPAKNQHPEDAYRTLDDGETYKASKYYIEDAVLNTEKTAVTSCKIYCIEQGSKKYLKQSTNSLSFVTDKSEASSFAIEKPTNDNTAANFIIAGSNNFCCNMQGGANGSAFAAYSGKDDANAKLSFWYYEPIETDPYKLGGKTYGLMNYTSGTHGFALMAGDKNVHTLVQLVTHKTESNNSATLYVDEGSEVTRWTFQSAGEDTYKLKGDTSSGTKYLTVNGDDLALTDSADSAAAFKVSADSYGRIRLGYNGKYVTFSAADEAQNIPASFSLTSGSGADTWLNLLGFAQLSDSDLITYSADRISVSEARSGQRVIVYTRLWNEDTKKYDIYAVDYNGTLYPCYASGGKILWLGNGTGSLEWVFTEYYDEVTKQPNYYYELYNPYSEKYIAPQMHDDQTLSSDTIGINMPGRRNGEFYSEIIAWDNSRYAYIGMKPNDEKTKLVPCSQSVSVPFYFAKLEDLNLDGELHEVATVDNTEHGITMKMFDFDSSDGTVTNYGTLTPIDSAGSVRLTATRTAQATPAGENSDKDFNYVVSYTQGADDGAARVDTVTNTREGGIAVRLFKWDSADALQGGIFTLTDAAGKTVGTYTSNSEGIVTILYNFEHDKLYTLTQTAAPKGYVGLQKTLRFKVNPDETVSLYYEDGTTAWGETADTDLKWANSKAGINGITAFVDVYNKPFNFKLMKTDSEDKNLKLGAAHFALYKQVNTTVSGYVKNKDPLTGFEDMVTKNGMVDICGGSSGRVINPGENGAVFFLTETKAPFGYTKLDDDIVLRISSIGVPSLISDSYNGQLVETDDSYIYTLSVPNVRTDTEMKLLTITKQVSGAFGSKNKDFTFTVEVQGAGENDEFVWAKNGEEQTKMSHSGGEFTVKHGDVVEIALPQGVDVKVTEKKSEYKTTFRLGDEQDKAENSVQFTFTDSTTLVVTNTLNGNVAAGLSSPLARAVIIICVSAACIGYILCRKRKERLEQN